MGIGLVAQRSKSTENAGAVGSKNLGMLINKQGIRKKYSDDKSDLQINGKRRRSSRQSHERRNSKDLGALMGLKGKAGQQNNLLNSNKLSGTGTIDLKMLESMKLNINKNKQKKVLCCFVSESKCCYVIEYANVMRIFAFLTVLELVALLYL